MDAEGDLHRPGERWTLVGTGFERHDDLMFLGVRAADGTEWIIPLLAGRDRTDVLSRWRRYARPVLEREGVLTRIAKLKAGIWIAAGSAAGGALVADVMVSIALDHNPQGEFRDTETGALQWDSLVPLGVSWAVPTAIVIATLAWSAVMLLRAAAMLLPKVLPHARPVR